MKEIPILFRGPMVRAILEGRKTQTRRLLKPPRSRHSDFRVDPRSHWHDSPWPTASNDEGWYWLDSPYGLPGDRLWVRETWRPMGAFDTYSTPELSREFGNGQVLRRNLTYRADCDDGVSVWRSAIHIPRWASRITLEVTGIRVERVQDISQADSTAEGWVDQPERSPDPEVHRDAARDWYSDLWCSLHGDESWRANPWVWVIEFKRVTP